MLSASWACTSPSTHPRAFCAAEAGQQALTAAVAIQLLLSYFHCIPEGTWNSWRPCKPYSAVRPVTRPCFGTLGIAPICSAMSVNTCRPQ